MRWFMLAGCYNRYKFNRLCKCIQIHAFAYKSMQLYANATENERERENESENEIGLLSIANNPNQKKTLLEKKHRQLLSGNTGE